MLTPAQQRESELLQIETVEIKRTGPIRTFYTWRCFPCQGGRQTEWIEKEPVATSACPECGKIFNNEHATHPSAPVVSARPGAKLG
jgi:hypothetical protein